MSRTARRPPAIIVVATRKITGEEDRYSHTDLWEFKGNLDGSRTAVAARRPVIDEKKGPSEPRWIIGSPRSRCCWTGTATETATRALTDADQKAMSVAVDALAEPVSQVAGEITT